MLLDPRKICFGEFEMDLKSALLVRGGTPVGLTGQPLAIFKMLQLDRVFPGLH